MTAPRPEPTSPHIAGSSPFTPSVDPGSRVVIVASTLPAHLCRAGDRATVLQARASGMGAIKVHIDRTGQPVVLVPKAGDGWSRIGEVSDP